MPAGGRAARSSAIQLRLPPRGGAAVRVGNALGGVTAAGRVQMGGKGKRTARPRAVRKGEGERCVSNRLLFSKVKSRLPE